MCGQTVVLWVKDLNLSLKTKESLTKDQKVLIDNLLHKVEVSSAVQRDGYMDCKF